MRELPTPAAVAAATEDPLLRWGAQALMPEHPHARGSAWCSGAAVAVLAPGLNRADRLLFTGPADDATRLLAALLPGLGPGRWRVTASTALAHRVADRLELPVRGTFGWMDLRAPAPADVPAGVGWLPAGSAAEVTALLRTANPRSYLFPDDPGAVRWAGVRGADGTLLSVGADAWPAPDLRFIAGVATHPASRGQHLSTMVCAFLVRELARHGDVALMADADNAPALRLYRGLGFEYRSVTALG
ncbi:GNAT family N-acetyltransferase [Saccharopolyspora sp. CA-218241]|uniref:GNAT family N-acetyltransferase n=1 Tax=Saccharopolyspora sp. CA-218241 TaxID=3240027 RepID=UPI003D953392